ncbi:MAG: hypothetical protein GY856_33055 [bacterium]|nr:hypothetical protein [bacterium]
MVKVSEVWKRLHFVDDLTTEKPLEGRKAADAALELLDQLDTTPPDLLGFAAQVDGSAWRANGDYHAAERSYTRAETIYRQALAGSRDHGLRRRLHLGEAEVRRRWSFLCVELCDWDRGLEMLTLAQEDLIAAGLQHEVGRVCLARGQLLWERHHPGDRDQALELLSQAVELIDPAKREAAFHAAEHNLTSALTLHPNPAPESLERAFEALQRSRLSRTSKRRTNCGRQIFGRAELTIPDAKRRYLQGKILIRLRQDDQAQIFLETARVHLMDLSNYPRDVFAVTLDLAECYLWLFRYPWRRIANLLADTFAFCPVDDLELAPEAQAALELFQAAIEDRNLKVARKHLDVAQRRFAGG